MEIRRSSPEEAMLEGRVILVRRHYGGMWQLALRCNFSKELERREGRARLVRTQRGGRSGTGPT